MAKSSVETNAFANLDDEAHYKVRLKSPVKRGRIWLRPCDRVTLKGKAVKEIAEHVNDVHPVAN